jgi:hypothetical protein
VGLFVGVVAIVLARKANRHAEAALKESADAERRAIERATDERKRLFELEILRDLLEACSLHGNRMHVLAHEFGPGWMDAQFGAQLMMIPEDELWFWRSYPTLTVEGRYRLLPDAEADREIAESKVRAARNAHPWRATTQFLEVMTDRFRKDVRHAIERRMQT